MLRAAVLALACLVGACGRPGSGGLVQMPTTDALGEEHLLPARICRPAGGAASPSPVAVIAHGLPPTRSQRLAITPAACDSAVARWFAARGYVVVFPLRRGYGDAGDEWAENPGPCADPDYVRAGLAGGRDLDAALRFAMKQPYAKPDGAVMVGEDAGGWAVLGFASTPRAQSVALVNIGGGMGASGVGQRGHICRPDVLSDAAATFGATARRPMLWIYASNDDVFPPAIAHALHDAFVAAGGRAELVQPLAPESSDGHALLFDEHGPAIWGDLLDYFLRPQ